MDDKEQIKIILKKMDTRPIIAYAKTTEQHPFNQKPPKELKTNDGIVGVVKDLFNQLQNDEIDYCERFGIVVEKIDGNLEVKFVPFKCNALEEMFNQ